MNKGTSIGDLLNREKRQLRDNCVKYYIITCVLDYLVLCKFNKATKNNKFIPLEEVRNWLYSQSTYDYAWGISFARTQLWILDMAFLDLIEFDENKEKISLTENGYNAYKSQQYHFAYASLLEAKNSRKLSRTALWVSLIATFIALLGIL